MRSMKDVAAHAALLYRGLLHLYPPAFRHQFEADMACDFEDATTEAWTMRGWIGVLAVWGILAADLFRAITVQWLRSGVPTAIAMSAIWTISCCVLIARQTAPRRDIPLLLPPRTADQEMQILLLGSAVVVLLIVATVLVAGWFWMSVLKRRSRAGRRHPSRSHA
jgi:hypothetical protein